MSKYVLSWDVGYVNLAYCLLKFTDDKHKIIAWDKINLVQQETHSCFYENCNKPSKKQGENIYCCGVHKKKCQIKLDKQLKKRLKCVFECDLIDTECNKCDKNAKWIDYTTFTPYCTNHKSLLIKKLQSNYKLKDVAKKSSSKIPVQVIQLALLNKMDELYSVFNKINYVVIENQPSFKNPKMKSISNTLMDHFLLRGIVDKKYEFLEEVKFMSPSNKLKIGDNKKIVVEKKKKYKLTKELGIKYTIELIGKKDLEHFNSFKKKDDIADCFLQGLYYYHNKN
jgi:hypothetical protein